MIPRCRLSVEDAKGSVLNVPLTSMELDYCSHLLLIRIV